MHLLVVLLQQLLGMLQREQPVPQPEPVLAPTVEPRLGDGRRHEGRLGGEGRGPDAFVRRDDRSGFYPALTLNCCTRNAVVRLIAAIVRGKTGWSPGDNLGEWRLNVWAERFALGTHMRRVQLFRSSRRRS